MKDPQFFMFFLCSPKLAIFGRQSPVEHLWRKASVLHGRITVDRASVTVSRIDSDGGPRHRGKESWRCEETLRYQNR